MANPLNWPDHDGDGNTAGNAIRAFSFSFVDR